MRHNIFNSKVPPQHTQKNGIFYGIHVIFCDHTITRFQQIHEKLLYSSQNASTFRYKRKGVYLQTYLRFSDYIQSDYYKLNSQDITDQFTFFLRSSFNCCQII